MYLLLFIFILNQYDLHFTDVCLINRWNTIELIPNLAPIRLRTCWEDF